jgi:histone H2B
MAPLASKTNVPKDSISIQSKAKAATKSVKVTKPVGAGKRKGKKTRTQSYNTYIYRVLKQIHPDFRISKKSMSIMNTCVNDIFDRIAVEAKMLSKSHGSKTLAPRDLESATRLVLPGELAIHAGKEGVKAVSKYQFSVAKK